MHGLVDWTFEVPEGGHRPVTLVLAEQRTAAGIREALFAGRTVVFFDDQLIGREEWLRALLEASVVAGEARYDGDTSILRVQVENRSEAPLILRNAGDLTLHQRADVFELPAHETTTLLLKLPARAGEVALDLEVLNAVTAPNAHPVIRLEWMAGGTP